MDMRLSPRRPSACKQPTKEVTERLHVGSPPNLNSPVDFALRRLVAKHTQDNTESLGRCCGTQWDALV